MCPLQRFSDSVNQGVKIQPSFRYFFEQLRFFLFYNFLFRLTTANVSPKVYESKMKPQLVHSLVGIDIIRDKFLSVPMITK